MTIAREVLFYLSRVSLKLNGVRMSERENLPVHIAVIPDGNRRWANLQGLPSCSGYAEGVKRFREVADAIFRRGIPYFTFWAASEDNLTRRTQNEINFLVILFKEQLRREISSADEKQTRFRVLGRGKEIVHDPELSELIAELEEKTRAYNKHNLTILFGYSGLREMAEGVIKLIYWGESPDELSFGDVKETLWTADLPPVDLVIRTGEMEQDWAHWSSGFMMWLTANAELYFPRVFWPEFSILELEKALSCYDHRQRRFGA